MKRIFLAGLLTIGVTTALFSREVVATGKSQSKLGDYKIVLADKPAIINGEACKAFVISYQNSPVEVTVVIRKDKKCKNYIVLSDKLTIQYVCNGKFFGVQKLDPTTDLGICKYTDEFLNNAEYFHQKLLAPGMRDEIENSQLIAVYYPRLLKEEVLAAL